VVVTTWYRVDDDPPPVGCLVFIAVVDNTRVVPATLSEGMWRTSYGTLYYATHVTHWTYLTYPQPPESTRTA
jgi:hypothetical protein